MEEREEIARECRMLKVREQDKAMNLFHSFHYFVMFKSFLNQASASSEASPSSPQADDIEFAALELDVRSSSIYLIFIT